MTTQELRDKIRDRVDKSRFGCWDPVPVSVETLYEMCTKLDRLNEFEKDGMEPGEAVIVRKFVLRGVAVKRMLDLIEADKDGRCQIIPKEEELNSGEMG